LIAAKVEGRETVEPAAPQRLAPVVDILEALKLSLAQSKKPVRSASGSAAPSSESEAMGKSRKSKKG
jgi:non-homologous end joining protein Ku